MNLFRKENDLIKRILNLILIVWLIIAVIITYNSAVNLLFEYKKYSYSEYKTRFCTENIKEEQCTKNHEYDEIKNEESKKEEIKVLINGIGNMLIVGSFIVIFNMGKAKKV